MAVINRCTLLGSEHPGIGGRRRGQGMVEFALILPLMLLLISGIIEFGRMLSIYNSVSNAAREAARYGSVVGDPGNGATYYFLDCTGMRDSAKRASAFAVLTDPDITIVYDHGSGSSFGACAQGVQPSPSITNADRVVITVTATYAPILPLLPISSRTFTFTAARSIFPNITTSPQCYDGIDNDGDGDIDFPADSDCPSSAGTSEGSVTCYSLTTSVNGINPSGGSLGAVGGTVSVISPSSPNCGSDYISGTTITLTANPSTGFSFTSWSGVSGATFNISGNTTATGNFTATCYTLSTNISPGGTTGTFSTSLISSPNGTCAGVDQYTYNAQVQVTANDGSGWVFSSWSICPSASGNVCTVTMPASDTSVTANYTPVSCYLLTVNKIGDGTGTTTNNPTENCETNTKYNSGTSVQITAAATGSSEFAGWAGCDSTSGSSNEVCHVTVNSLKTVTATFNSVTCYSLLRTVNGLNPSGGSLGAVGGTVSVISPSSPNCGSDYISGTSITLAATPTSGFSFTSWSGVSGATFNISGNTTATGNFTANCYTLTKTVNPDTTSTPPVPSASGSINVTVTSSPNGTCAGANQYTYNTQLQLQAVPAANYTFSTTPTAWDGTVSGSSNPITLTMPAAGATAIARFNANCVLAGSLSITPPGASSKKIQLDYTNYTAATRTLNTLYATWPGGGGHKFSRVYFGPSQDLIAEPTDASSPTTIPGPGMNWSSDFNRGISDPSSKTLVLEFNFNISGSFLVQATFDDGCTGTPVSATFP